MPTTYVLGLLPAWRPKAPTVEQSAAGVERCTADDTVLVALTGVTPARALLTMGTLRDLLPPGARLRSMAHPDSLPALVGLILAGEDDLLAWHRPDDDERTQPRRGAHVLAHAWAGGDQWGVLARSVTAALTLGCFRQTASELAEQLDIPERSLRRNLSRQSGSSPWSVILRGRMNIALSLRAANLPTAVIAQFFGYCDVPTFSRSFTRVLGVTPGQAGNDAGPPSGRKCQCCGV